MDSDCDTAPHNVVCLVPHGRYNGLLHSTANIVSCFFVPLQRSREHQSSHENTHKNGSSADDDDASQRPLSWQGIRMNLLSHILKGTPIPYSQTCIGTTHKCLAIVLLKMRCHETLTCISSLQIKMHRTCDFSIRRKTLAFRKKNVPFLPVQQQIH